MRKLVGALGTIGFIAVLLVAMGIGKIGGKVASQAILSPSKEEIINTGVAEVNKTLPMMVDPETRLDSASSSHDYKHLIYNYTFVNYRSDQITAAQLANLKDHVINQACAKQKETLLNFGIPIEFSYKSFDGLMVQAFVVRPGKCIYDPYKKAYGLAP